MKILKLISVFLIFFTVAFLISCEDEKDKSKIAISLKSGHSSQEAKAGDKIHYELEIFSVYSKIKQFTISSFERDNGIDTLHNINPNEATYNYTLIYEIPEFSKDTVTITLTMIAVDYDNNSFTLKCYVTVTGGAILLEEMSGIVMYSGLSDRANAFSIEDPSQIFLRSLADSTMIDVYDYPLEDIENTAISREWRSNTDVKFTKANNFNYSKATLTSIKNTYNSSNIDKRITNLQPNDIILFSKAEKIFGTILITDVIDNEGTDNDYYRFNIKLGNN